MDEAVHIRVIDSYGPTGDVELRLLIRTREGFDTCLLYELIRVDGDSNYSHFVLQDGSKITAARTLGDYEPFLTELGFYRIHQSRIIHLLHVRAYRKPEQRGQGGKVKLSDGQWWAVSKDRRKGFLEVWYGSPPPNPLSIG